MFIVWLDVFGRSSDSSLFATDNAWYYFPTHGSVYWSEDLCLTQMHIWLQLVS